MNPFCLRSNPRPDRCAVHGCRTHIEPGTSNGRFCRRCREHRYRITHPHAISLNKLRNNARRRGHAFDITLEEWIMFCDLTGYTSAAGRGPDDLSIDRIDPRRGYTLDNIRTLTGRENRRKAEADRKITRHQQRQALIRAAVERAMKAA